jgi:hypothetical protein
MKRGQAMEDESRINRTRMVIVGILLLIAGLIAGTSWLLWRTPILGVILRVIFMIFMAVGGMYNLLGALLLKLGKVKPGKWWGQSAISHLLQGLSFLLLSGLNFFRLELEKGIEKYPFIFDALLICGIAVLGILIIRAIAVRQASK